jgi:hypothetical protein
VKALSIKQPWAWAILYAGKEIENRSWRTQYRGPLVIHAGAQPHPDATMPRGVRKYTPDEIHYGAILGVVDLVDVVEESRSRWFGGPYGWVLTNPRRLQHPIPCKGRLGLWPLASSQLRALRRQIPDL